jgi:hypothetical protein
MIEFILALIGAGAIFYFVAIRIERRYNDYRNGLQLRKQIAWERQREAEGRKPYDATAKRQLTNAEPQMTFADVIRDAFGWKQR